MPCTTSVIRKVCACLPGSELRAASPFPRDPGNPGACPNRARFFRKIFGLQNTSKNKAWRAVFSFGRPPGPKIRFLRVLNLPQHSVMLAPTSLQHPLQHGCFPVFSRGLAGNPHPSPGQLLTGSRRGLASKTPAFADSLYILTPDQPPPGLLCYHHITQAPMASS